jgi:hypothetical protein
VTDALKGLVLLYADNVETISEKGSSDE